MRRRVVRIGLIGVGRWGRVYLKTLASLRSRCRVTHLCTSDAGNARLVPGSVRITRDWRRVIDAQCDAVIIATPPQTHAQILDACLDIGTPCIVEKPLCLDVPTAQRLHRRVQAARTPVLVDHTHLLNPGYQRLARALDKRGEPIRVLVAEGANLGPFRLHTPTLWDWAPHDLSLCLDLMGRRPAGVAALGGPPGPDGEPEAVSLRLDFRGGAHAWIHAGRLSVRKRRSLSVFTPTRLYVWDDLARDALRVARITFARRYAGGIPERPAFTTVRVGSAQPPMERMLAYFLDGLEGGDRRYFGTGLALNVVKVLAQCENAMRRQANIPT